MVDRESFDFLEELGRGSQGTVWLARRKSDGREYVIKQVQVLGKNPRWKQEALNEVRVMASLRSPFIIAYEDCFVNADHLNIVMEYASRGPLANRINECQEKGAPLSESEILSYFIQICLGLRHIHAQRVIHRDIKPLNLFVDASDCIKIGDMGLSRMLSANTHMANTGIGSPYYLAPELCEGKPYGHKSDMWSLGVVLYELCTLRHPFAASNPAALIMRITQGAYKPLGSESTDRASPLLTELVAGCLRLSPELRFDTCDILAHPGVRQQGVELGLDGYFSDDDAPRAAAPASPPTESANADAMALHAAATGVDPFQLAKPMAHEADRDNPTDPRAPCRHCGRRFAPDRIQKHEGACESLGKATRAAFDATTQRLAGVAQPTLPVYKRRSQPQVVEYPRPGEELGIDSHSSDDGAPRAAAAASVSSESANDDAMAVHAAAATAAADDPCQPTSRCRHCGRSFAPAAYARHEPKCATIVNKPKPLSVPLRASATAGVGSSRAATAQTRPRAQQLPQPAGVALSEVPADDSDDEPWVWNKKASAVVIMRQSGAVEEYTTASNGRVLPPGGKFGR